jgi:hypothetical protein
MRRYGLASTVHRYATDGLYANGGEDKGPWKGEESCTSRQLLSQCSSEELGAHMHKRSLTGTRPRPSDNRGQRQSP